VIDAGGYEGEWPAGMISRYGCKSKVYEPVPTFFEHCKRYFKNNAFVEVHMAALGGSNRKATFQLFDNGTSEFRGGGEVNHIEADVIDVADVFVEAESTGIACLKLNIEGGEYEVLERMAETDSFSLCDSLLIQFHRQPEGYKERYKNIIAALRKTHNQRWCYEMVWEKWVRKEN
jgi:FkbM family methyltransferase